ncbi:MAG: multidrug efflux RND transporter permease subunit [Thiobacillus sp. 65-69]|nr:efflux RND transporter permease subunit [Thiobacillus sp.]ODU90334.1 MAG: multidrug efflux RND transporter permease subunit [Thiobacillus sp. SCN 65-179]OJW34839.1 MAG: multidrug efflux RND transporter permease subunit [Thiobacillus sp. 65-69]
MARFFIYRPIFAWVIAILILLGGAIALKNLPVAQYPAVAPPQIAFNVTYPGASAQVVEDTVIKLIEQQMNGIEHLLYMEASSELGSGTLTLTFEPGTDIDISSVEAQNRYKRVESRLPDEVRRLGVPVTKPQRNYLMFVAINSKDGKRNAIDLGSYAAANVLDPLLRVPGVGEAILFGTEYSMRIWLKPEQLTAYGLTPADVKSALQAQNVQLATGELNQAPASSGAQLNAVIVTRGRLATPEEFGDVVVRALPNGATVKVRDVARVELGGDTYERYARMNGQPIAAIAIRVAPGANALDVAKAIKTRMTELAKFFPEGVDWAVPYDTSRFVEISIFEVVKTLGEAMILVFIVMYVFLGHWRTTLIPAVVVPVALAGATMGLYAFGFSINVLTLFAMVLAIGVLVDDAIVVVENVERIMREEKLPPLQATLKAMDQIIGAILGISVVLSAVFMPMLFFGGSVGAIYRQFAATLILTMAFSVLMALTLTPAMCATLLKSGDAEAEDKRWFNRMFGRVTLRYHGLVGRILSRTGRWMVIYLAIVVAVGWLFTKLPGSFLPDEDQGYFITMVQLPGGATQERTVEVLSRVEQYYLKQPEVERVIGVVGFSFFGRGQNAALVFTRLKDWEERIGPEHSAQGVLGRAMGTFSRIKEAMIFAVNPPSIPELGAVGGFDFRLQDRSGQGREALMDVRNMVLGMAAQDSRLAGVRPEGQEPGPQVYLDIDRTKAQALQIDMASLNDTLSSAIGVSYVNDFVRDGRILKVQMQADADLRKTPEDLLKLPIRNRAGGIVLLGEIAQPKWIVGLPKLDRYNGNPSVKIAGSPSPGHSTGEAMQAMEEIAGKLPPGYGFAWSGTSYEERLAGSQAPILFALSMLVVFLALAALYESWAIPFSVMLIVPLGILGAVLAVFLRDLPNDVFFKVGLIAIIGLSAKNAILIIEFARQLHEEGMGLVEATLEACRLRLRPILMTSFAFILGVMPLAISSGAGAASRHAVGTGVVGGMIAATVLAIFFVPVFFVVIRKLFPVRRREEPQHD